MPRPYPQLAKVERQRLIAAASLVLFAVANLGVPVPRGVVKNRTRPFPCQDHACGCATAEQCWRDCCCYSHAEKLAWAKRHGVVPPESVVAAERAGPRGAAGSCSEPGQTCCDAPQHSACCGTESGADSGSLATDTHNADFFEPGVVLTLLAKKCGGMSDGWLLVSQALPTLRTSFGSGHHRVVAYLRPTTEALISLSLAPPTPPPQTP